MYFVKEIKWASCAVVSIEYVLGEFEDRLATETNLRKTIEKIRDNARLSRDEERLNRDCRVKIYHDDPQVQVGGCSTISSAFEIVKEIHKTQQNNRRGIPHECILVSIRDVATDRTAEPQDVIYLSSVFSKRSK